MAKFGEYNPDGSVKVEADECALTGRKLSKPFDNTIRQRFSNTPYFVRYLGSQQHLVTDELLTEWQREIKGNEKPLRKPVVVSEGKE